MAEISKLENSHLIFLDSHHLAQEAIIQSLNIKVIHEKILATINNLWRAEVKEVLQNEEIYKVIFLNRLTKLRGRSCGSLGITSTGIVHWSILILILLVYQKLGL